MVSPLAYLIPLTAQRWLQLSFKEWAVNLGMKRATVASICNLSVEAVCDVTTALSERPPVSTLIDAPLARHARETTPALLHQNRDNATPKMRCPVSITFCGGLTAAWSDGGTLFD